MNNKGNMENRGDMGVKEIELSLSIEIE